MKGGNSGESGFRIRVPDLEAPLRLDLYLLRRYPAGGRKYWRELLAKGAKLDGRRAPKGALLRGGEEIWLPQAPEAEAPLQADPEIPLELLYEDAWLFAVDKTAGLPCHPLRGGNPKTLAAAVLARFPGQSALHPAREAGLVHRLDNETSGVLLFAKSQDSLERLREASQAGRMRKLYWARVSGELRGEGRIEFPVGHDPKNAKKMRAARDEAAAKSCQARHALTHYRVLESGEDSSLLEVEISVGARHQIRVHLQALGHPLLGDPLYGGPPASRLALHARELGFEHPFTGEKIRIVAPPPGDFPGEGPLRPRAS